MTKQPKIRLYVPQPLGQDAQLTLEGNQAHYAGHVMRMREGECLLIFNGDQGEWLADITMVGKKHLTLAVRELTREQAASPDLWLVFAPIKSKTELVMEKATELGVSQLHVVYTRHAVVKTINRDKMQAHIIEAAEQCERLDIPALHEHKDVSWLMGNWPKDRTLLYGDETGSGTALGELLPALPAGKYALLIGPEGGFSTQEHQLLKQQSFVKPFSLGPRILRADTAAVAALACMQAWWGDWRRKPSFGTQI